MKRLATVAVMQLIGFLVTMECAGAATTPNKIVIAYASLNEPFKTFPSAGSGPEFIEGKSFKS